MNNFDSRLVKFLLLKSLALLFLLVYLVHPAHTAHGAQIDKVKVGIFHNKPMCYFDVTGKPAGIFVAVIEYVAAKEGWDLIYVEDSFSSLLTKLEKGEIDLLLSTAVSEQREQLYEFNETDVFNNWAEIYILPKAEINSLLELKNKRVATLDNGIYSTGPEGIVRLDKKFNLNCEFIFVDQYKTGLKAVTDGKADAAVVNRLVGAEYAKEFGLQKSGIVFAPVEIRFALNKKSSQTPSLIRALDRHLAELVQDNNSIYHRTITEALGSSSYRNALPRWILVSMAAAVGLILVLTAFITLLRWQVKNKTRALNDVNIQLKHEKEFIEISLNSQIDTFFVFDSITGKALRWNKSFKEITGYTDEEISSLKAPDSYYSKEDLSKAYEYLKNISSGAVATVELDLINKDGDRIPTEYSASIIKGESEESDFIISIGRDVRERKRNAGEKEKLENQLRHAQKMEAIGTLAGGIAHDFNNILSAVLGYTELAQTRVSEQKELAKYLNEVYKAANRAKELVKQIMTFSRQTEHELKPLEIHSLVKDILKLLRPSIPTTIEIHEDIDTHAGNVLADPSQIHQVFMNLCTNAYQAMREKGGTLAVKVEKIDISSDDEKSLNLHLKPGAYVRITVVDNGVGIDHSQLNKIFEPYYTTKQKGEGTGLGLALVHGIVNSHGGHITVYSEPDKGTTFHVYLPSVLREAVDADAVNGMQHIPVGHERILVVDDEEPIAKMEQHMLESWGYQVTCRTNSVDTLSVFKSQPDMYDLIITDMTMPGMTGVELAQAVRQCRPDVPVILCTGFSELISKDKADILGISKFLTKPVTRYELAVAVREVLDAEKS